MEMNGKKTQQIWGAQTNAVGTKWCLFINLAYETSDMGKSLK